MLRQRRPLMSDINVTPLVDVMLVLLVIFMITAPLMEHGLDVDLPKESTSPISVEEDIPTITLKRNQRIFWNKQELTNLMVLTRKLEGYREKNHDGGIVFRADQALSYGFVMKVLSTVKRAGIQNIGMATEPISS